jgi:hypothetical protein
VIEEEEVPDGVVGHRDVQISVPVDIDRRDGEGLGGGLALPRIEDLDPRDRRDIGEGPISVVAVESAMGAGEVRRLSVGAAAAGQRASDRQVDLPRPGHVLRHEEVEVPVEVRVEERGAGAPRLELPGDSRLLGDLGEAIPVVAVEPILAHGGDEQVGSSVTVVVPDRDAGGHEGVGQAPLLGDILEAPGAVVSEEAEGGEALHPGGPRPLRPAGEQ